MSSNTLISSEQALEEYFSALLDESLEVDDKLDSPDNNQDPTLDLESEMSALEPVAQMTEEETSYAPPAIEVELPNLDDVERLLEQLESTNPVADLQLEEVMDQNTTQISETNTAVEEAQDWPVDDDDSASEIEDAPVESLEEIAQPEISAKLEQPEVVEVVEEVSLEPEVQSGGSESDVWHSTIRDQEFQVLYFEVNGVTFAVPLDELGGIHRIAELNHLIGRPDWYLGLQIGRDAQLDVVDTAKWVMAEKLDNDTYKDEYQYIVMLDKSMWGLASTQLKGTESINPEKVRWRKTAGKRPWLAGMVKEKMCALIHVEALVAMLNAGLDVKALDK